MFFNNNYMSQKQKFYRSLILMFPVAIIFSLIYIGFTHMVAFVSSFLYLILGYGIGYITFSIARSFQPRFGLISAGTAVIMLFLGDIFWPWLFAGDGISFINYIQEFFAGFYPLDYHNFIRIICYVLVIATSYLATFKSE